MRQLILILAFFLFTMALSVESSSATISGETSIPQTKVISVVPVKVKTPTKTTIVKKVSKSITKTGVETYTSPAGKDSISFSVTVRDGIITAASAKGGSKGISGQFQSGFAKSLLKAVVGKKVAGLSLDAVGGASLTTAAFEKFVAKSF